MGKILVVDDDSIMAELVSAYLVAENHIVNVANGAEDAKTLMMVSSYDLLILDWMLPDSSGLEICKTYRSNGGTSPILMLTSRSNKYDKAAGLDAGADDYLVKPFDQVEFLARVRALLRRPNTWCGSVLRIRDLELDTQIRKVSRAGKEIQLRPREYALLEFLARHPGQNFTAETIFKRIWNSDSSSSVETVRMHVMALRKKLGDSNEEPIISSVRGLGYRIG